MAFGGGTVVVPGVRAAAGKAVGKAVSSHAVVPGVRAAAGKAGSSQSSLVKAVSSQSRILRRHLSIATGYVFDDGARAVFFAFLGSVRMLFMHSTHRILGIELGPQAGRSGLAAVCEA